ncbi:hypothetical protein CBR_g45291 [Chara braunii]|uniref:Uncharacterized protein n=1 Tax=Chara braunii TaxID=69332 RepID=A0A388LYC1_CHABU|nr:hypothetical protein CBR_g45291 [Chara braunii]|eukprot:GBG87232.1 hypothetical protein CBR_g45291 [Chara braunii]
MITPGGSCIGVASSVISLTRSLEASVVVAAGSPHLAAAAVEVGAMHAVAFAGDAPPGLHPGDVAAMCGVVVAVAATASAGAGRSVVVAAVGVVELPPSASVLATALAGGDAGVVAAADVAVVVVVVVVVVSAFVPAGPFVAVVVTSGAAPSAVAGPKLGAAVAAMFGHTRDGRAME